MADRSRSYFLNLVMGFKDEGSQKFGEALSSAGEKAQQVGKSWMRSAAVTGAAIGGLVKLAADSERGFAEVSTLLSGTAEQALPGLIDGIKELESTVPHSRDTLTNALYQILSASVPPTQAMEMLTKSARLATAGLAEVNDVADVGTSIMNAYGLEVAEMDRINDQLFATVKYGKTTLPELAGGLGRLIPIAAAGNFEFVQIAASIAELTKQGQGTDLAITGLRSTITAMIKPTDDAYLMLRKLGGQAYEDAVAAGDFVGAIEALSSSAPALQDLSAAFPNIRALSAVSALVNNSDDLRMVLGQVADSAGSVEEAYDKMSATVDAKMKILRNQLQGVGIEIGSAILPIVTELFEELQPVIKSIMNFIRNNKELIKSIAKFALFIVKWKMIGGAIMFAVGGVLKFAGVIAKGVQAGARVVGALSGKFAGLAAKMANIGVSGPAAFGLLGIAIVAVVAIIDRLVEGFDDAHASAEELAAGAEALRSFHETVIGYMKEENGLLDDTIANAEKLAEMAKMEESVVSLEAELNEAEFAAKAEDMAKGLAQAVMDSFIHSDMSSDALEDIIGKLGPDFGEDFAGGITKAIEEGDFASAHNAITALFEGGTDEFNKLLQANDEFAPMMESMERMMELQTAIADEATRARDMQIASVKGQLGLYKTLEPLLSSMSMYQEHIAGASGDELDTIEAAVLAHQAKLVVMAQEAQQQAKNMMGKVLELKMLAREMAASGEMFRAGQLLGAARMAEQTGLAYVSIGQEAIAGVGQLDQTLAEIADARSAAEAGEGQDTDPAGGGTAGGDDGRLSIGASSASTPRTVYNFYFDDMVVEIGDAKPGDVGETFEQFIEDAAAGRMT